MSVNVKELCFKNPNLHHDLETLRKWVQEQKGLPYTSDLLLFLCLHSSINNIGKAKEKIKRFYTLRKEWPAVFKNRNPCAPPFRVQLNLAVAWPLSYLTEDGYKIILIRLIDSDVTHYDLEGQVKLVFLVMDYWAKLIGNIEGFVLIVDHTGFSWSHLTKFRLGTIKKYMTYSQEAQPIIIKQVHLINVSVLSQKLFVLTKLFMKKETSEIMHVHANMESLYKYVPQRCLPKDYGGDDVSIKELHQNMVDTLLDNSQLLSREDETGFYD